MNADCALAIQHIIDGEARCGRQAALIVRLRAADKDTAEAEALLAVLEEALGQMYAHLRLLQGMSPKLNKRHTC